MRKKTLEINFIECDNFTELNQDDQKLITSAREAADKAYAPYSNFNVGAAVLLENGEIIKGNNQENSAYTDGLCAERVALFYANANYNNQPIKAIAVSAKIDDSLIENPIKPCGSCRQALLETEIRYNQPIKILLDSAEKIQIFEGISTLLPFAFEPDALKE